MRYRNTQTGAEIDTECRISGEHWRQITPTDAPAPATEKKTANAKKAQVKQQSGELRNN